MPTSLLAQGNDSFERYRRQKREQLQDYRDRKRQEFDAYRAQKNREFAEFLARGWQSCDLRKGLPVPKSPDPVAPVVSPVDPAVGCPDPVLLPVKQVKDGPASPSAPPPDIPLPHSADAPGTRATTFFGTSLRSHVVDEAGLGMKGCSEREVSKAWARLSGAAYDVVLSDCQEAAKRLSLSDWGLFLLADTLSRAALQTSNEARVLHAYLMAQFGYDVRLCRLGNDRLGLLVPIRQQVCGVSYYEFNRIPFYLFGAEGRTAQVKSYGQAHGNATRMLDLGMRETPALHHRPAPQKTFGSPDNPGMACTVEVNSNLMDFYAHIPQVNDWAYYASQPFDKRVAAQLYPAFRAAIRDKSPAEAAGMLLDFVQKAFSYQTDSQQFGREKYNFAEENFFYKACDCEDRAVLYSRLVRDLLQLDVVLLHYPNHVATAVRFPASIEGDHVLVDGRAYTVCDPTYIGAGIGICMPKLKAAAVEIVRIGR